MPWTFILILLAVWAIAMAASYTAGGFIHVLLLAALVVVVVNLFQRRRPLA